MVLYDKLAKYWPLISPPSHYLEEGRIWEEAIRKRLPKPRPSLLDLGCGGGHSLAPLAKSFECRAVDLSPSMVELSKKLNPNVEHFIGDMRTVRLGRKFDVVTVNDAIGYMTTRADIMSLLQTAKVHLESGGFLVIGPDWFKETFEDNRFNSFQRSEGEVVLNLSEFSFDTDPTDDHFETVFTIIVRDDDQVETFCDRHTIGLFGYDQWKGMLEASGFEVEFEDYLTHGNGRPNKLVIGRLK